MMPPVVVLIVCKALMLPQPNDVATANSKFTGHQPYEWQYRHSKMICRRQEVQMYDPALVQGADPQPFSIQQCQRSGIMLGATWDETHTRWKYWRTACPVPVVDTNTGKIVDWHMPDCTGGRMRGKIICDQDTVI